MDITKYNTQVASDNAQTLNLRDPFTDDVLVDSDGNTVDIYLYGIQSTAARNAIAERERRSNKKELSDEESKELGAEFLAKLTVGWSDNIEVDGKKLTFNYKNAVKLYMDQDWIGQQVISFISKLENYAPKA